MERFLLAHPRGSGAFLRGLGVLFSCCFFPILPVSGGTWGPVVAGTLALLWALRGTGRMQAVLYPGRGIGVLALWNLGAALAGLACRFLLEFGEVSNAVNFAVPNVLLHLLLAAGCAGADGLAAGNGVRREGTGAWSIRIWAMA